MSKSTALTVSILIVVAGTVAYLTGYDDGSNGREPAVVNQAHAN